MVRVSVADCPPVVVIGETVHVASCGHPATPQLIDPLNPPLAATVSGIGAIDDPAAADKLFEPKLKLKSAVWTWNAPVVLLCASCGKLPSVAITVIEYDPDDVAGGIVSVAVTVVAVPPLSVDDCGLNAQGIADPSELVLHASVMVPL